MSSAATRALAWLGMLVLALNTVRGQTENYEITRWRGERPNKVLAATAATDFENGIEWEVTTRSAFQSYAKRVEAEPIYPDSPNPHRKAITRAFNADVSDINQSAEDHGYKAVRRKQKHSLEIKFFAAHPGKSAINVNPIKPLSSRSGRAIAFALWVKGSNTRDQLTALLTAPGAQTFELKLGQLSFQGWRRIEKPIPPRMLKRNQKLGYRYEIQLVGFNLHSHPQDYEGLRIVALDLPMFLLDRSELKYPGSKIYDNWPKY